MKKFSLFSLFLLAAFSVSGCHIKDMKDYCEAEANCEGYSSNEEDACVEYLKAERKVAKIYDCKDKFDNLVECMVDKSSCEEDSYDGDATSKYYTDDGACDSKEESYATCMYGDEYGRSIYPSTYYTDDYYSDYYSY